MKGENKQATSDKDFKNAMESVDKYYQEINDFNSELIRKHSIPNLDVKELLDSSNITGKMSIVSRPRGTDNRESFGVFSQVWVDQGSVGDSGDSFAGTIYGKFGERKWLAIPYEC